MNHFPAIPLLEHKPYDRIRELYLYQEPALLVAIRRGDRGEARRIINHVLVQIYSAGEERSELLKGLLLELVVMISRAAVEAGALLAILDKTTLAEMETMRSQVDVLELNLQEGFEDRYIDHLMLP